ncbi:MAG TPA: ATP-binding cassette domain-containing protein [Candidatus Limnocylindrales bacterium]|nr:ATP-binding cassette domain-containing protein [Candidatus Limnocylindrales bacterium]
MIDAQTEANVPGEVHAHSGVVGRMEPILELVNVSKFFGSFKAVDDISFRVEAGSICGFLGPNGAGKTTTIRMILEIIRPTSGSITVLGHRSALEVRQRLGYLPEEKGLYKKMKAWSIIAYFATLKGMTRKAARERAYELLEAYGLEDFADKPTDALSKGMGQKVQLLASIAHDPELVILDEPFSGLDPVNQQVMEEVIRDMAARQHTVLFSTHVMQHAERLCDRILLLAKGRKIFDGTIPEAKRLLPRRIRLETADSITPLHQLPEVISARKIDHANGTFADNSAIEWELELQEKADAEVILQACFTRGIRLRNFNQSDPTLHEVFVRLVGPEAREAGFR